MKLSVFMCAYSIFLFLPQYVLAENSKLPHFSVASQLKASSICSGSSVSIKVTINRGRDSEKAPAKLLLSTKFNISVTLRDSEGRTIGESNDWDGTVGETEFYGTIAAGESISRTIIVNRWVSTSLEPGSYSIALNVDRAKYSLAEVATQYNLLSEPYLARLPLVVTSCEDGIVEAEFANLLAVCRDTGAEISARVFAYDSIVLAKAIAALPVQIELLKWFQAEPSALPYNELDLLEMMENMMRQSDVDLAKRLIELSKDELMQKEGEKEIGQASSVWRVLSWGLHELHRDGDAEVREYIAAFIQKYPKPSFDTYHMTAFGMNVGRDY